MSLQRARVTLAILVLIGIGYLGVVRLAGSVQPTQTTTTSYTPTTVTIPRSAVTTTTVVTKKPYKPNPAKKPETRLLSHSEVCELARVSPSGEAFVAELFIWGADNLAGTELDTYADTTAGLIWDAYTDKPCKEPAQTIIRESIQFMVEVEG